MKKKKILLIVIPILLVILIGAVIAVLFLATDIFKGNDALFAKYALQNESILEIIEDKNTKEQSELKKNGSYSSTGNANITYQQGENTLEFKATTASRHDAATARTYSEVALKNGEADALKVSYVNDNDSYAIKCDDILGYYIGVKNSGLKDFAQKLGVPAEQLSLVPDKIDFKGISEFFKLTDEQKKYLYDTYSKVIVNSLSKEKYSKLEKAQLTIDGTNYEANGYAVTIDEATLKQLCINVLNTLKSDNNTLTAIGNKRAALGIVPAEQIDITKIPEAIDKVIAEFQKFETGNEKMIIKVYESKGKTIRTTVEIMKQDGQSTTPITIDLINKENDVKAIIKTQGEDIVALNQKKKYTNNPEFEVGATTNQNTTGSTTNPNNLMEITLEKVNAGDTSLTETMITPYSANPDLYIKLSKNIGKVQNNTANNSFDIIINAGNNTMASVSYKDNTQFVAQVEAIPELQNTNTIFLNNYTLKQLTPFLQNLGNKIEQVVPAKVLPLLMPGNNNS